MNFTDSIFTKRMKNTKCATLELAPIDSDIEITKKNISKCICYIIINACFCAMFYTIAFCGPKIMEASHDSFIIAKWAGRVTIVLEVFLFTILCLGIYSLHLLKDAGKKNRK